MAKTETRQVSIFLNGEAVSNTIKGIAAAQRKMNNELAELEVGSEAYNRLSDQVLKANTMLKEHNMRLRGVSQGYGIFKTGIDSIAGLAAGAFAVDALIGYGKELFNTGVKLDTLERKARTVFAEALPAVTAEAERNARAMGLTNAEYVDAAASIQDLLVPMGFMRKEAANISTGMVNLSGALSEWTGGQIKATEVAKILQDAVLGEREELKQLGISISEADVTARLAEKGLDKLTGTMRQQAEATATLELITEKSTDAQIAFADGTDTAVRRQAEMAAKITEIGEKLSRVFLPVFERLASVVSYGVDRLSAFTDVLDDVVGLQKSAADSTRQSQVEFNALIGVLQNVNASEETRKTAIAELQTKYGAYIGKVNLQKASEDELNKVLNAGNELFAKRIFLQSREEKILEFEKDRAKTQRELFESEKQLQQAQQRTDTGRGKLGFGLSRQEEVDKFSNVVSAYATQLEKLNASQKEFEKEQDGFASRFGIDLSAPNIKVDTNTGKSDGSDAKKRREQAKKLEEDLTELLRKYTDLRADLQAEGSDNELAQGILAIERRYGAEIDKATELEKAGVQRATQVRLDLEALKDQAVTQYVRDQAEKAREQAENDARQKAEAAAKAELEATLEYRAAYEQYEADQADARAEIASFTADALLTDREREVQELKAHYKRLLDLANQYRFNTVEVEQAYAARRAEIAKETTRQQEEETKAIQEAQAELALTRLDALANGAATLEGFFEKGSSAAKALFFFQKTLAAVEVVVSLQRELAAIAASNAALGPAAPAVITALSTAAKIRSGLRLATIAATTIKEVQQRYEGGYLKVQGEKDGRQYNAQPIDYPDTGLLPHHPVLFQSRANGAPVLASERGQEYFVAAPELRKPRIANLVRMIHLAKQGRSTPIEQYNEGGYTGNQNNTSRPGQTNTAASTDLRDIKETLNMLNATVASLNALLQQGLVAIVPDRTVIDIRDRLRTLNDVSGGYYS